MITRCPLFISTNFVQRLLAWNKDVAKVGIRTFIQRPEGWESVIGLEVHAAIDQDSKLFSSAAVRYGAPVNTQVSLFDAAIPGTLPVLNRTCVEAAVLTSLALSCHINKVSYFDRKHYFYADLPSGYQITQHRKAIANDGELRFMVYTPGIHKAPYNHKARIRQIQLEQDSGKSLHDEGGERSLIDLNRAGVPLMEIVFEPDLKDGEEAGALVKELLQILLTIGTCNCKMEEGSLRVDANISVNPVGGELGTRTEVKNLGSIRALVYAIEYEVERQIKVLKGGGTIVNETRSYDAETKSTMPMRDKEVKQDYRFMPEPNLPPLRLNCESIPDGRKDSSSLVNVHLVKKRLKELPEAKRQRLIAKFALRMETAMIIVNTPGYLSYFESVMEFLPIESGNKATSVLQTLVIQLLNESSLAFDRCPLSPKSFSQLYELVEQRKLNLVKAKEVLNFIFNGDGRTIQEIVIQEGWMQVGDEDAIERVCRQIISANPKAVAKYKRTKDWKHANKLMGEIRKATGGKYDMKKVDEALRKLLDK